MPTPWPLLAMTPVVVASNPSVGWGGAFHFARGSGERLFSMPPAKSTLIKVFGAPLVAATCQLSPKTTTMVVLFVDSAARQWRISPPHPREPLWKGLAEDGVRGFHLV